MSLLSIPHMLIDRAEDLAPAELLRRDIRILFMDLDNTLSPYHIDEPTNSIRSWVESIKTSGIEPFILSNNRGDRPRIFSESLDIGYVGRAGKPSTKVLRKILYEKGIAPENAAIIGDQIYTDALCAGNAGLTAIVVRPICLKNPLLALRYGLEAPFRFLYKVR